MVLPWPRCLLIYFCVDDRITAFLIELWCARCWAAVAIGLGSLMGGILGSVTVLAFSKMIQLMLDIEQNTRQR